MNNDSAGQGELDHAPTPQRQLTCVPSENGCVIPV
jgi:hypothetical protein